MFSGVFRISSLILKWIIGSIILSALGFTLALHGGVNLESARYANQPTWIYQLEIYLSFILLWPITIYGWFYSYVTNRHSLGLEVWIIQFFGYGLLYFLFTGWCRKKSSK
jgi:hypothetical protein